MYSALLNIAYIKYQFFITVFNFFLNTDFKKNFSVTVVSKLLTNFIAFLYKRNVNISLYLEQFTYPKFVLQL
jgi:hypothetical protein